MDLTREEHIRLECAKAAAAASPNTFYEANPQIVDRARALEEYVIGSSEDERQDPLFSGDGPEHRPEEEEPQL